MNTQLSFVPIVYDGMDVNSDQKARTWAGQYRLMCEDNHTTISSLARKNPNYQCCDDGDDAIDSFEHTW